MVMNIIIIVVVNNVAEFLNGEYLLTKTKQIKIKTKIINNSELNYHYSLMHLMHSYYY